MSVGRISGVAIGLWMLPSYLFLVFWEPGSMVFWALNVLAPIVIGIAVLGARRSPPAFRLAALLALLGCATTLCLLLLDTSYRIFENLSRPPGVTIPLERDLNLRPGEVNPRRYYPTDANFLLHKPSWHIQARIYGESYNLDGSVMLQSPTLREEVLEPFRVEYQIDRDGFRATAPMEAARIFALGDSFTFGVSVRDRETWPWLLAQRSGVPIYNLGVTNTSPAQQVWMLTHLLESRGERFGPEHLIWMLFDGNDLEDSYAPLAPRTGGRGPGALLEGSLLGIVLQGVPEVVRSQSVLRRIAAGELTLKEAQPIVPAERRVVDGVPLSSAVYRSTRYGTRAFPYPPYIERATKPRSYVLEHPNRPHLDRALGEMRDLSERHGFRVTVVLTPSAARIYGPFFDGFPQVSERPHLLDYLREQSEALGFETIDLVPLLQERAPHEMLYRRDDTHWTPKGNQVVADYLARELFRVPNARADEAGK